MNQHEIVQKTTLLRRDGSLAECGWARHPYFAYRRDYVKGPLWLRLKEWDYYAILDEKAGFWCALTYSDLGYAGLFAVAYVDLTLGNATRSASSAATAADLAPRARMTAARPIATRTGSLR